MDIAFIIFFISLNDSFQTLYILRLRFFEMDKFVKMCANVLFYALANFNHQSCANASHTDILIDMYTMLECAPRVVSLTPVNLS